MRLVWSPDAWDDYVEWQRLDRKTLARINRLIEECRRTPFSGTGKPEPLRGDLSGWWSHRVDREHRLAYRVRDNALGIAQCRYHY